MTIPSVVDSTLAPVGKHVVNMFVQYTPYTPNTGPWTADSKAALARHIFSEVDRYMPLGVLGVDDLVVCIDGVCVCVGGWV